jgi:hypothetical protein
MNGLCDRGSIDIFGAHRGVSDLLRDGILILMGVLSLTMTATKVREDNDFTWAPMLEVACLFAGIFISMVPCLIILKAGTKGAADFVLPVSAGLPASFPGRVVLITRKLLTRWRLLLPPKRALSELPVNALILPPR